MTSDTVETSEFDVHFYWDPVCPFAWITSRWVEKVARQRDLHVDWRFISLRLLNKDVDYAAHFPPGYERGHTAGLRMLRVAAAAREKVGREAMGELYSVFGGSVHDVERPDDLGAHFAALGTRDHTIGLLDRLGLPEDLADALDDETWDAVVDAETEEALALTGRDVGTPIVVFQPPDGLAFFGPVISHVPNDEDSLRLWDAVIELTGFPGFAEIKRSLREAPALRVYGMDPEERGEQQDWHQGSLRQK